MKYLHTMVRVTDLDDSLDFYCNKLGLVELRRTEVPQGRFTLVLLQHGKALQPLEPWASMENSGSW